MARFITNRITPLIAVSAVALVCALGLGASSLTKAQSTTGPRISSIAISGWTGSTATISFSLNIPQGVCQNTTDACSSNTECAAGVTCMKTAEAQIEYGTTSKYGQFYPVTFAVVGSTDVFNLTGLTPATTYHYRLKVRALNGDSVTDTSADRTFSTKSGDAVTRPTVIIQNVDCTNVTCIISFSTNVTANVKLAWDTAFHNPTTVDAMCDTSNGGYPNCVGETAGTYSSATRTLRMTGLDGTRPTLYHYRLSATDSTASASSMTGSPTTDLTVTTAAGSGDHTFSTGNCSVGGRSYPIGACLPTGETCTAAGPVGDCTSSCGYNCAAGKTCNQSGLCLDDPTLTNSPYQCNQSDCYSNGIFSIPAAASCYASWPKCSANTILKVKKDRACNLWLTCGTSMQTTATKDKPAENLCLSLSACNQLGANGQCIHYLPQGQCDNDQLRFCGNDKDCEAGGTCVIAATASVVNNLRDLTFNTPSQIKQVANLSGNVIVGLDWSQMGGSRVIQGGLPWQLMRQIGGNVTIVNGDFETNAPQHSPWIPTPENQTPDDALSVVYEDQDNSVNHILKVSPVTQIDTGTGSTSNVQSVYFSGVTSAAFTTSASEYYFAQARIRADGGTPTVRFELGYDNFTKFDVNLNGEVINTFTDIQASSVWQTVTIGPIKGISGVTRVAAVCADNKNCSEFWIDDIQVKPGLQINTNPDYLAPSCRLYPRDDAPACDYTDQNGVTYKGWRGYCLERDSQTDACISWWPVDIIKGESNIFGSDKVAGYQDRTPVYMCAEAVGNYRTPSTFTASGTNDEGNWVSYTFSLDNGYLRGMRTGFKASSPSPNCDESSHDCRVYYVCEDAINSGSPGICVGSDGYLTGSASAVAADRTFTSDDISAIKLVNIDYYSADFNIDSQPIKYITAGNSAAGTTCSNHDGAVGGWTSWATCYEWTSNTGNEQWFAIHFVFDADKKLSTIEVRGDDGSSDSGSFYINPQFLLKERCNKIVKVVDDDGSNNAFAGHVTSKVYSVPDLGYKMTSNVTPFSGLVGPNGILNPEGWPIIHIETKSGEYDNGQARGGSPYACASNCSGGACHLINNEDQTEGGKTCSVIESSSVCTRIDSDMNGKMDGICSGGVEAVSNKGVQIFDNAACVDGACAGTADQCVAPHVDTCTTTKPASGSGKTVNIARAVAAGTCKTGTRGVCSGNNLVTCANDSDCVRLRINLGTCINKSQGGTWQIACAGRCGGAGENRSYNTYQENVDGLQCTQLRYGNCIQEGTYRCSLSGRECDPTADNCALMSRQQRDSCTDFVRGTYKCVTRAGVVGMSCSPTDRSACDFGRDGNCQVVPSYYCTSPAKQKCTVRRDSSSECITAGVVTDPVTTCRDEDAGCQCTTSGQCAVSASMATYTTAGVSPKSCTTSADCKYDPDDGADAMRYFAQEHIKRLFTKSYGIWAWQGSSYQQIEGGWTPPTAMCPTQEIQSGQCLKQNGQCTASIPMTSDARPSLREAVANGTTKCKAITTPACDGRKTECTSQGVTGSTAMYDTFTQTSCPAKVSGGTTTYTCSGRCTSSQSYWQASYNASTITTTIKGVRPTTPPGDYCAIPPQVFNVAFSTGMATTAIIDNGSGSVAIRFNVSADTEQVPLEYINIDWDDGEYEPIPYQYAPRSDPRNPMVVSHPYTYNQADREHCQDNGSCTYHIRIQVKDNWGWCNDASVDDGATVPCHTNSNDWIDTNLTVVLNP